MNASPFMGSGMSLEPFVLCHSPFTAEHMQGLQYFVRRLQKLIITCYSYECDS